MVLKNINYNYRVTDNFINNNIGDTKPNVLNNNLVPYFVYDNQVINNINPLDTNDDTIIEALEFFDAIGDITKLTTLLDYILFTTPANFGISRILEINPNVFVGNGKTPYIYQYLYNVCYETYNKTVDIKYLNEANDIKLFLTSGDSYDPDSTYSTYAGVSSIVMYDINNLLITNRRYGFYISDINPLTWLYSNNEIALYESIQMIEDSQNKFSMLTSNVKGLVYPYFNRNIQENNDNNIMPINDWTFYGILGNETDFIYSYLSIKNLAEYYYKSFSSYNINRDIKARNVIKNFVDYIYSYYLNNGSKIPDYVEYKEGLLYVNNTRLTVNETNVFVNSTFFEIDIIPSKNDYSELYKKCLLALVCYYKWKVDNYEPALLFLNSLIDDIKKYQGYVNDTIVDNSDIYVNNIILTVNDTDHHVVSSDIPINNGVIYNQIVFLMSKLFYLYKNIPKKTAMELINESLKLLELQPVSILSVDENYYTSNIKQKIQTILNELIVTKNYTDFYREFILPFNSGQNIYDLRSYEINSERIEKIWIINQALSSFVDIKLIHKEKYDRLMLQSITQDVPIYYCIKQKNICLYPIPDKDYQITIGYYLDEIKIDYLDQVLDIPTKFYYVLKWSLATSIAQSLNIPINEVYKQIKNNHLSALFHFDNMDSSADVRSNSCIDWRI